MKKFFITVLLAFTAGFLFVSAARASAKNVIPVAMASDDNYIRPTIIAMSSIMENKSKNTKLKFYIMLSGTVSKENRRIMKTFEKVYPDCTVELLDMKDKFKNLYLVKAGHISLPTYYRLCIPSLLKNHKKMIYLDGDIIVRKDLWKMYNTDISKYYLAGVKDFGQIAYQKLGVFPDYSKRLGVDSIDTYINAGVLLMNLDKMRKDNMEKKFMAYAKTLKKRGLGLNDQDVLNATCYKKIKILSPEYNAMQHFTVNEATKPILDKCYDHNDWEKACNDPTIIHYSSSNKPWRNQGCRRFWDWSKYRGIATRKLCKKSIADGVYRIVSALDDGKVVDVCDASRSVGAKLQLWESNFTDAQNFRFKSKGDGFYEIEALCSGKSLEVKGAEKKPGAAVWQQECTSADAQKWYLVDAGGGYYHIFSKCNDFCLDISAANKENGTQVQLWVENGTDAQKFKLAKCK